MPSLEWNTHVWDVSYRWPEDGEEWSDFWGSSETQWAATLLPRIRNFVPAGTILEIAPGHGRWTRYLLSLCNHYIGVDLSTSCIETCRQRFRSAAHASFFVNDGRSLSMVPDGSVDFAFSFDSLVHVEAEIIRAYLAELSRVMAPQGIAFLHHSNLGAHLGHLRLARLLERTLRRLPIAKRALRQQQVIEWDHARAWTMTAERFAEFCQDTGLVCVGQEIIDWGLSGSTLMPVSRARQGHSTRMIDCLSLVARPGSQWQRANVVVKNPDFMSEAFSAAKVAGVYTSLGRSPSAATIETEPTTTSPR